MADLMLCLILMRELLFLVGEIPLKKSRFPEASPYNNKNQIKYRSPAIVVVKVVNQRNVSVLFFIQFRQVSLFRRVNNFCLSFVFVQVSIVSNINSRGKLIYCKQCHSAFQKKKN